MSVLARSNVQILWEVLNGLISENQLKIKDMSQFKSYFDHKCKEYHVKRFDYNGLSDINKHIVAECFEYLKKASQDSQLLMFREYEQYGNKNIVKNLQIGKRYEEHQNNFKSMINAKRPNEVDFTESTDIPINNMDDVMSKRLKEREAELDSIKTKYNQNHDSIKWLNNSGDIPPKLKIHDNEPAGITESPMTIINELDSQKEKEEEKKEKKENKKKKVKFHSDFLKNLQDERNEEIEKEKINDDAIKEKAKMFQEFTENLNIKDEENSKIYLEKREIINIMNEKEEPQEEKETSNIMDIFSKMKTKTKNSDIEGSNKVDLIDVYKRMDKLENYLVDILKNQIDLKKNQEKIISKNQYNDINKSNEEVYPTFSAI